MSTNSKGFLGTAEEELGTEVVTIRVGQKGKEFVVHKNLVCKRSSFFNCAFNGGFKESEKGILDLPEDRLDAFDCLIKWIYRDELPDCPSARFPDDPESSDKAFNVLMEAFILAEKLCIEDFKNKIMDRIQDIQDKHNRIPYPMGIRRIYQNTSEKSKLRLYCAICGAREVLYSLEPGDLLKDYAGLGNEFVADLFEVMNKEKKSLKSDPRSRKSRWGACRFHTHGDGVDCHLNANKPAKEETLEAEFGRRIGLK